MIITTFMTPAEFKNMRKMNLFAKFLVKSISDHRYQCSGGIADTRSLCTGSVGLGDRT